MMKTFSVMNDENDRLVAQALLQEADAMRLTEIFTAAWTLIARLRAPSKSGGTTRRWSAPETV